LVSEPKGGVDAMDDITKKQPSDNRRRGDTVIVDWCWENQGEKKRREEGKKGEFNTHGTAAEPLKEPVLKTRRKRSMCTLS
jgi:hypothetical protein